MSNGNLTSGEVKSCGCLSHIYHGKRAEGLVGQTFNDLTVLNLAFVKDGHRYWHCKCKCGNEKYVETSNLTTGRVKSCGCRKYSQIKPGDKFGKLTVISKEINGKKTDSSKCSFYKCQCECGNITIVRSSSLIRGITKSCGCGRHLSYNEEYINNMLIKLKLPFIREYEDQKLDQLYPTHGRKRTYDFFVNNFYYIEYDGSQHFKYTGTGWDTKDHFDRTRKSDLIKNKYCFDNNIPLIRIPYDAEYTIDDLKLETTKFLLTPKNEKEYYESRIVR